MEMRETAPKEERETIISYDAMTETWHFYSNEPKHIRKWSKFIQHVDQQAQNQYGNVSVLEGDLDSVNVTISKKRRLKLTDEQREQARKRMLKLQQQRKEKDN